MSRILPRRIWLSRLDAPGCDQDVGWEVPDAEKSVEDVRRFRLGLKDGSAEKPLVNRVKCQ
jgi:hypothetical protein